MACTHGNVIEPGALAAPCGCWAPHPLTAVYSLLHSAIDDPDDRAIFEAAAILAAGHGVRFIVTIHNGLMANVHAERLDYDTKGKIR